MATRKEKLDFKMVLIIVLTIGLAITIYTLTTQSMANRSSAAGTRPVINKPQPTKGMDTAGTKCTKLCSTQKSQCNNSCDALKQDKSWTQDWITSCKSNCANEYKDCKKGC